MSLITDSDEYFPRNTNGVYIDFIPSFHTHPQGLRCPCTGKPYSTRSVFSSHVKTVIHKRWIEALNTNSTNHYEELEKEKQICREQKIIIAQMERDIAKLEREKLSMLETIHILSNMNKTPTNTNTNADSSQIDLIDFD
jgi:hypothetical protein